MAKTVLVIGASAGIGKATAICLAQNGYNVYGAARMTEKMQDLKNYGIKVFANFEVSASYLGLVVKFRPNAKRRPVTCNVRRLHNTAFAKSNINIFTKWH